MVAQRLPELSGGPAGEADTRLVSNAGRPTAVVIAAGDGTRWGDYLGVPKHLADVEGEAVVHRIARQAHARGFDVHIVGLDERYRTPFSTLHVLSEKQRWPTDTGADKFLSSRHLWNKQGRTVLVYGDVFFTEQAMATIADTNKRDWTLFCRFGPNRFTKHKSGECFALSLWPEHHEAHLQRLWEGAELVRTGELRRYGGWEHYRRMVGLAPNDHVAAGNAVEIDDWTDDFDRERDYRRFVVRREIARSKGRLGDESA